MGTSGATRGKVEGRAGLWSQRPRSVPWVCSFLICCVTMGNFLTSLGLHFLICVRDNSSVNLVGLLGKKRG